MFFDNASTTKLDEDLIDELKNLNEEFFYNPGGLYSKSRNVKKQIEDDRKKIIECLGGESSDNFVFTGSATEGNNLAIMGVLRKNFTKMLFSMGEHPSVYNTALELKNRGYNVEFITLDKTGKVDLDDFKNKMTADVDFVSIMHVSNETGAINDICSLVEIAKGVNEKVIFHSDGVQAYGKIDVDVSTLGVDMYTISAHKIYGCKGIGGLYIKKGVNLKPIIFGGGQESGLRSGTENYMGIHIFSKVVERAKNDLLKNSNLVKLLKLKFIEKLSSTSLKYSLHSYDDNSPYIVSVSFDKCRAETLLNMLNDNMIYIGNGSACSSKNSGNRILQNMGVPKDGVEGNLRISFSKHNTVGEVEKLVDCLSLCVGDYLSKAR